MSTQITCTEGHPLEVATEYETNSHESKWKCGECKVVFSSFAANNSNYNTTDKEKQNVPAHRCLICLYHICDVCYHKKLEKQLQKEQKKPKQEKSKQENESSDEDSDDDLDLGDDDYEYEACEFFGGEGEQDAFAPVALEERAENVPKNQFTVEENDDIEDQMGGLQA